MTTEEKARRLVLEFMPEESAPYGTTQYYSELYRAAICARKHCMLIINDNRMKKFKPEMEELLTELVEYIK